MHLIEIPFNEFIETILKVCCLCFPGVSVVADFNPGEALQLTFIEGLQHRQLRCKECIGVHAYAHHGRGRLEERHGLVVDLDAPI